MTSHSEPVVIISEHATACGRCFGQLTLNKPKALNALDLDMALLMLDTLQKWQSRDDMLFVIIDSVGDKAFCAGGDIVSMYNAMRDQHEGVPEFIARFFTVEYELDYTIHTYSKPVVVWGDGIVMGGGMGLLSGASHRVATENTRMAMPEITIGLFPDVGGSYFLPKLAGKAGLFLGLTAAEVNGTEALSIGLADYLCANSDCQQLISAWQDSEWQNDVAAHLTASLKKSTAESLPDNRYEPWAQAIEAACSGNSLSEIVDNILALDAADDRWMQKAQGALKAGSPITANLFYQQFKRGETLDLAACFQMELIMACRCAEYGELQEGIRALLIDKDGKPSWRFKHVDEVPAEVTEHFFASPFADNAHPLAHLG